MRKILTLTLFLLFAFVSAAQNVREVRGVVMDANDAPIVDATIKAVSSSETMKSGPGGTFTMTVSPFVKFIEASYEGYVSMQAEIDGSYLIFRLKEDKKYWENKAKAEAAAKAAEEEARLAEQKRIEMERLEAERQAIEKAKAEEADRIAKEKAAAAKAKAEEEARIAAQKQAEADRIAKEKAAAAKAKAEEEARIAAQKQAEADRIAKEKAAAAKAKAEEDARIAAQKRAEAERVAKEKAKIAAAKKEKRDAIKVEYAKPIKGYGSFVNASYALTNNEVGIDYIGGYRFNNLFFLGAGAGATMRLETPITKIYMNESLELSHGAFYFPVYLHFRAQLLNRRCAPFLALSAGYNISLPQSFDLELISINYNASGVFVNPQIGVTYRIKPKFGIYCAAGFNAFIMPECIGNTGYSATIKQSFKYGINVNLGISF